MFCLIQGKLNIVYYKTREENTTLHFLKYIYFK